MAVVAKYVTKHGIICTSRQKLKKMGQLGLFESDLVSTFSTPQIISVFGNPCCNYTQQRINLFVCSSRLSPRIYLSFTPLPHRFSRLSIISLSPLYHISSPLFTSLSPLFVSLFPLVPSFTPFHSSFTLRSPHVQQFCAERRRKK